MTEDRSRSPAPRSPRERSVERREKPQDESVNKGNTLYVGGLGFRITDSELQDLFEKYGKITSCRIIKDRGESRGFGFVSFEEDAAASAAASELHGTSFNGRNLTVELSKRGGPRQSTPGEYMGPKRDRFDDRRRDRYDDRRDRYDDRRDRYDDRRDRYDDRRDRRERYDDRRDRYDDRRDDRRRD